MTTVNPTDLDDSGLAEIGRHWGLLLVLGLASIAVGIAVLVWPGATILVVAVILAAWLLVSGVVQIIRGFGHIASGGLRVLLLISGLLSVILGLLAISGVWRAVEVLAILIAVGFLFRGLGLFVEAAESADGRGWSIFGGIVLIVGGIAVLVWPGISLVTLAWVAGIILIVQGIFEVIAAFGLRRIAKAAA